MLDVQCSGAALAIRGCVGSDCCSPPDPVCVHKFEMDPMMRVSLKAEEMARLDRLRAERAWDLEKHKVARRKLEERFKDRVEHGRFIVKCIRNPSMHVAAFRTIKPTHNFAVQSSHLFTPIIRLKVLSDRIVKRITARREREAEESGAQPDDGEGAEEAEAPEDAEEVVKIDAKLEAALNREEVSRPC